MIWKQPATALKGGAAWMAGTKRGYDRKGPRGAAAD